MKTYSAERIHWLKHHVPTTREEYLDITAHASQFPPAFPRTVYLEIGERCNLDCTFCSKPTRRKFDREMDWATIQRVIKECGEQGCYYLSFHDFGEPLLHLKYLLPAIAYAKECGIPIRATTTNGTPLTKKVMQDLIDAGLTSLHISFEGANQYIYEQARGVKYWVMVDRIREAVAVRNANQVYNAQGQLVPWIAITMVLTTETPEEVAAFMDRWQGIVDDIEARPALEYLGRTQFTQAYVPPTRIPCRYVGDRLIIMADGTMTACSVDVDGELNLGNVIDGDTIASVWHSNKYLNLWTLHQWEAWESLPDPCKTCGSWDFTATARSDHLQRTLR